MNKDDINLEKSDLPSKRKPSEMELTNDGDSWNRLKKLDEAARKRLIVKPKYGIPPPKRKK